MKKAVIVVGSHHAGKSRTIKEFFKPLVGLSGNQRLFSLGEIDGVVLSQSPEERSHNGSVISQSLEEKGLVDVVEFLGKYAHYNRLVLAARPANETVSLYSKLKAELEKLGFGVLTVNVVREETDSIRMTHAKEIFAYLQ